MYDPTSQASLVFDLADAFATALQGSATIPPANPITAGLPQIVQEQDIQAEERMVITPREAQANPSSPIPAPGFFSQSQNSGQEIPPTTQPPTSPPTPSSPIIGFPSNPVDPTVGPERREATPEPEAGSPPATPMLNSISGPEAESPQFRPN